MKKIYTCAIKDKYGKWYIVKLKNNPADIHDNTIVNGFGPFREVQELKVLEVRDETFTK